MKRPSVITPLVFWVLLLLVMTMTQPNHLPVLFLMIPYALLWGGIYHSANLLLNTISSSSDKVHRSYTRVSIILATAGVLLVALQSIGQLTPKDAVVAGLLIVIGHFYLSRNRKSK